MFFRRRLKFKYKLARGAKYYRCGPGIKRDNYQYTPGIVPYLVRWTIVAAIWTAAVLACILIYLAFTLPDVNDVIEQRRQPTITILDREGKRVASINDMYGERIEFFKLPPHVWQAVVAIEDRRFFRHSGVDARAVMRAVIQNVRSDARVQGGSTISQQLAKNLFLSPRKTMTRKTQELMLTLWLERKFSKEQILSLYLSRVSIAAGKFGFAAAAESVFGKSIYELEIPEAAILAGMLRSPSHYNPATNWDRAHARMRIVLDKMLEAKYITQLQHAEALLYTYAREGGGGTGGDTRYFIDYVMGALDSFVPNVSSDITIHTTLDLDAQKSAEAIVASVAMADGAKYGFGQAAALFMRTDGGILVMVGGRRYADSQFNRAVQMRRQPGSAFKPFVYLVALEAGMKPADTFVDEITSIGKWAPRNHDDKYHGKMTMTRALELSVNTVIVQIAKKVGINRIISSANRMGLVEPMARDMSITLGTADVSLLDLTSAYAVFANKGVGVLPYAIERIVDERGNVLWARSGSGVGRLVRESVVADMNFMLTAAVEGGTGANARVPGVVIAGKTGTSNENRDAWFVGFTSEIVGGIWIGNDNRSPMGENTYGGGVPARIFRSVITYMVQR
ncbi:MAG: PBP1A family penicillin-binding protein [Alphaproteobacteria bacterium]|nr:PBP1A family penicillin-binding protein [Alphaproteobacteria bacterium]